MKISSLKNGNGRDLYGTLTCEHCEAEEPLIGGYNDSHWHDRVLPAFHCGTCGKNRAGEQLTAEVTARNQSMDINGI